MEEAVASQDLVKKLAVMDYQGYILRQPLIPRGTHHDSQELLFEPGLNFLLLMI